MVLPPRLRYGLVRLQALNRPVLWGVGVGAVVLALVVRQYGSHPEWFSPFEMASSSPAQPNPSTDLAQLSAEELAGLAEIDNLTLLLNQMQPTTTSTLTPAESPSPIAPLPLRQPPLSNQPDAAANPFRAYLDQLQFQGGGNRPASPGSSNGVGQPASRAATDAATGTSPASQPTSSRSTSVNGGIATTTPPTLPLSPLQQALDQNGANRNASNRLEEGGEGQEPTLAPSGLTPPPWMIEGQIPGVNQRFIRTTPEMSPLPGTTGYTRPPTLPAVAESGAGQPGQVPAPAPLDLNFRPGSLTLGPNSVASPGVASPALVPSSGLGDRDRPALPEAAPFSVPRPPGTYTGGGYIYTFSDPNGPVD